MRKHLALERAQRQRLALEGAGAQRRALHGRTLRHHQARREVDARPADVRSDDHDAAVLGERVEVAGEVHRADELEQHVRADAAGRVEHGGDVAVVADRLGAQGLDGGAAPSLRTTPSTRAPQTSPIWQAALPTPPAAPCTSSVSPETDRPGCGSRRGR